MKILKTESGNSHTDFDLSDSRTLQSIFNFYVEYIDMGRYHKGKRCLQWLS